jgi:hypothetical protein
LLGVSFRNRTPLLLAGPLVGVLGVVLALHPLAQPTTIQEAVIQPEPRLRGALAVLAASPASAQLRRVLDTTHVVYRFTPMPPRTYARYSVARKAVEIDMRWRDDEPVTLAAVIAHEAVHVQDAVSGYLSSGEANACVDSELRAFRASARFWTEHYGSTGKLDPGDELEEQLNLIAVRQQQDPAGLEQLVRQTYVNQCGS